MSESGELTDAHEGAKAEAEILRLSATVEALVEIIAANAAMARGIAESMRPLWPQTAASFQRNAEILDGAVEAATRERQ